MRIPEEETKERVVGALRSDTRKGWSRSRLSICLGVDKESLHIIMDELLELKKVSWYSTGKNSGFYVWVA